MTPPLDLSPEDCERATLLVPPLEPLAPLVYELVSRQAEGRVLYSGERFVSARAEAHGIDRVVAETPLGNLLGILERGPESAIEWALLSALYVRGLVRAIEERPDERKTLIARFVTHSDWLESATTHRPLSLARSLLPDALAQELWEQLGAAVLREDSETASPRARGLNALRIAALANAAAASTGAPEPARIALTDIEGHARDAFSRTLASLALGRAHSLVPSVAFHGALNYSPRSPWLAPLRWLTGFTIVRWLVSGVVVTTGIRHHAEVELAGRALRVQLSTRWFGRRLRSVEQVHELEALRTARCVERFASFYTLSGVAAFAIGVLSGGALLGDAARAANLPLALWGAGLVLAGAVLDLLFSVVIPASRGRARVELDFGRAGRLRVAGVQIEDAERFLRALVGRFRD